MTFYDLVEINEILDLQQENERRAREWVAQK